MSTVVPRQWHLLGSQTLFGMIIFPLSCPHSRLFCIGRFSSRDLDTQWLQARFNEECFMVRDSWDHFYFVDKCLVACEEKVESTGCGVCYPCWLANNLIKEGIPHDGQ